MAVLTGELADRVSAEAEQVRPGLAVLTAVAAVLYALGWVVGVVFTVLGVVVRWSVAAVRVGWADGRAAAGRRGPAR